MSENCICFKCMRTYKKEFGLCPFCGHTNEKTRPEPLVLEPGTVLQNKYLIGEALGHGGFSVTYIGFDLTLQIKVAVKEYLPAEYATRIANQTMITVSQQSDDAAHYVHGIDEFMQEAKRIASLDDIDGIVKVFDAFMENNTAYIVMEYLEGENLSQRLKKEGKLEPQQIFTLLMPMLTSLSKVHEAGLLHRDISPENIFFTTDEKIKLIDFGASRKMPRGKSRSLSVYIKPGYTPAEQYTTDGNQGTWTDVYSLAATIYKMITGVTPPDGLQRSIKDNLLPPSKLGVKISRSAENALLNAMNVRVSKRTKTVEEFQRQLYSTSEVKRKLDKGDRKYLGGIPVWARITLSVVTVLALGVTAVAVSGVMRAEPTMPAQVAALPQGKVYMPRFYNKTVDEAKAEAKKYGLAVEINDSEFTDDIPVDKVYVQYPAPHTVVDKNSTVKLTVSAGPKYLIELPKVHGMALQDAKKLLEAAGFTVEVAQAQESVYGDNIVCKESLTDRSIAYVKKRKIVLTPSASKQEDTNTKTRMPSFTEKAISEAEQLANTGNVRLKIVYQRDQAKENQVISQSIKSGEACNRWVTVTLTVSSGLNKYSAIVPSVKAKTEAEAIEILNSAGLKYEIAGREYSDFAKGKVISQSIDSGKVVRKTDAIVRLVISLGKEEKVESKPEPVVSKPQSMQESSKKPAQSSVQTSVQQIIIQTQPQQPDYTEQEQHAPAETESSVPSATYLASGFCGQSMSYVLHKDGTMEIKGSGEMDKNPFQSCIGSIRQVKVESGVTSIGSSAFSGASNLSSIELPDTLTEIGEYAFKDCTKINVLSIPTSVQTIGEAAFSGWTKSQIIRTNRTQDEFVAGWDNECGANILW